MCCTDRVIYNLGRDRELLIQAATIGATKPHDRDISDHLKILLG